MYDIDLDELIEELLRRNKRGKPHVVSDIQKMCREILGVPELVVKKGTPQTLADEEKMKLLDEICQKASVQKLEQIIPQTK